MVPRKEQWRFPAGRELSLSLSLSLHGFLEAFRGFSAVIGKGEKKNRKIIAGF